MNTERQAKMKAAMVEIVGGARRATVSLDDGTKIILEKVRQGVKLRLPNKPGKI